MLKHHIKECGLNFFFCIMTNCAGENETQEGDEIAM